MSRTERSPDWDDAEPVDPDEYDEVAAEIREQTDGFDWFADRLERVADYLREASPDG